MIPYKASRKRNIIFNGGLSHLGELEKYKKSRFIFLGTPLNIQDIDLRSHLTQHYKSFLRNFALPRWNANLVVSPSHVLRGDFWIIWLSLLQDPGKYTDPRAKTPKFRNFYPNRFCLFYPKFGPRLTRNQFKFGVGPSKTDSFSFFNVSLGSIPALRLNMDFYPNTPLISMSIRVACSKMLNFIQADHLRNSTKKISNFI